MGMMHQHYRQPFGVVSGGFCVLIFVLAFMILPLPCRADTSAPSAAVTQTAAPALWNFAWVSDMHMNPSNRKYTISAMRYIETNIKPHFVLFTGDNNYIQAPPAKKGEPKALRRQRFFKQFLQKHLATPAVVIPGDNWPQEFEKVFGPRQYSFDCGGLHFLLLAPDRIYHGKNMEGLSVFDESTWQWIRNDLNANRTKPTAVVIHEPIYPMTFLDAPPLRKLLKGYPNVFAALQGHVHVDMEYRRDGKVYLVAPSLEQPPTPGMKLVDVTPTSLVVRTILYNKKTQKFEMQPRRQVIEIPANLRSRITKPKEAKFVKANFNSPPAKPVVSDPSLEKRKNELMKNAMMYFLDGRISK